MKQGNNYKIATVIPLFAFLGFSMVPAAGGIIEAIIRIFILGLPALGLYFSINNLRSSESAAMSVMFILASMLYSLLEAFVIYIEVIKLLGGI